MTMIADTSRIPAMLDWTPQYDDLETLCAHALAWEQKLVRERERASARRIGLDYGRAQVLI
jgi:UDP-glucose 4-epimerase